MYRGKSKTELADSMTVTFTTELSKSLAAGRFLYVVQIAFLAQLANGGRLEFVSW